MLEVYCLFLVSFDHHTSYYLRCCWHSTKLHLYDQNVTILTISRIYGILIVHLMLFSFQNFVSFCMEAQAKPAKLKIYWIKSTQRYDQSADFHWEVVHFSNYCFLLVKMFDLLALLESCCFQMMHSCRCVMIKLFTNDIWITRSTIHATYRIFCIHIKPWTKLKLLPYQFLIIGFTFNFFNSFEIMIWTSFFIDPFSIKVFTDIDYSKMLFNKQ